MDNIKFLEVIELKELETSFTYLVSYLKIGDVYNYNLSELTVHRKANQTILIDIDGKDRKWVWDNEKVKVVDVL